jgi:hypothetical protein
MLIFITHSSPPKLRRSASFAQQDFFSIFLVIFFEGEVLVLWYRCEPPRHLLHLPALVPTHPPLLCSLHHVRCPPLPQQRKYKTLVGFGGAMKMPVFEALKHAKRGAAHPPRPSPLARL